MTGAGTQKPIGISFPKGKMVEESASSVPVPLLSLTSKICAEHYCPLPTQRFRAVGSTLPGKASVMRRSLAYFPSQ